MYPIDKFIDSTLIIGRRLDCLVVGDEKETFSKRAVT